VPRNEALYYYSADEAVAPDASALGAWTKEGTGTATFDPAGDGLRLQSTADRLRYMQALVPSDTIAGPQRGTELIEVQAYVRGRDDAGYTADDSGIGLVIYDGLRGYMLSIGDNLQWLTPDTGTVVKTIKTSWDWARGHSYRMRKEHAGRVELWIDGVLYDAAPPTSFPALESDATGPARAGFGIHSESTSDAVFNDVEVTLNRATPPQWKVLRSFFDFFAKVRDAWTEEARALLRATVGLLQTALDWQTAEFRDRTAEDLQVCNHSFRGDMLPMLEDDAWSWSDAAGAVVREHLMLTPNGNARGVTGLCGERAVLFAEIHYGESSIYLLALNMNGGNESTTFLDEGISGFTIGWNTNDPTNEKGQYTEPTVDVLYGVSAARFFRGGGTPGHGGRDTNLSWGPVGTAMDFGSQPDIIIGCAIFPTYTSGDDDHCILMLRRVVPHYWKLWYLDDGTVRYHSEQGGTACTLTGSIPLVYGEYNWIFLSLHAGVATLWIGTHASGFMERAAQGADTSAYNMGSSGATNATISADPISSGGRMNCYLDHIFILEGAYIDDHGGTVNRIPVPTAEPTP
jgi:hypothetical protein